MASYLALSFALLLLTTGLGADAARATPLDALKPDPAAPMRASAYFEETHLVARLAGEETLPEAADTVAWAEYTPQDATRSAFGRLRIETNGQYDDNTQMTAMGYLEGFLSAQPIFDHWRNMQWYLSVNTNETVKLNAWLTVQREWMAANIESQAGDPFWDMQALIRRQLEGMVEGMAMRVRTEPLLREKGVTPLSLPDLMLLNSFGDMDDLLVMMELDWGKEPATDGAADASATLKAKLDATNKAAEKKKALLDPRWNNMTPAQARAHIGTSGHCSALIKVTSDLSDILMGHTTWWSYSSLLRLYKHYVTALHHPGVAAQQISFSSYPGVVHSMDDFNIMSSGLVMMETSNNVYDLSLYALSTNHAALSWQRARAACMLATDGPSFAEGIQRHNSGTYNNQYMIVDLNKFTPGQQLQAGLLTVVETMPGGAVVADTTQELERGYWPSYNIPYFAEVYNKTGVPDLRAALEARGPEFLGLSTGLSYQVAPRAKIFRRDSGNVNTLGDLKRVLRSNGWTDSGKTRDPFSPTPWEAICARGDLDLDGNAVASGCYDAKVTSYALASKMQSEAINGPAWDGDGSDNGHDAFVWSDWKYVAHYGMPREYRTVFELQSP